MRLTGGEHRGRILRGPAAGTRPTQDKVRAAVFSALAAQVPDSRFLDLFAGTGACGLEAWSRGAAWVEWIEQDRRTLQILKQNLSLLKVPPEAGRPMASDVFRRLALPPSGGAFDLVYADPPYAEAEAGGWQERLMTLLAENGWLLPGGIFVYEAEERLTVPLLSGWRLARDKTYGSTRVLVWIRE